MDSLSISFIKSCFFPIIESAENACSEYINQYSFHNCGILVIDLKLANLQVNCSLINNNLNLEIQVPVKHKFWKHLIANDISESMYATNLLYGTGGLIWNTRD
jgi:hypothetical protein